MYLPGCQDLQDRSVNIAPDKISVKRDTPPLVIVIGTGNLVVKQRIELLFFVMINLY